MTTRAKKPRIQKEADLGPPVIRWLENHRWDVYQEVPLGSVAPRADIAARLGSIVCVVELKLGLSFDLIAQARDWTRTAHWVFVAIPEVAPSRGLREGLCYLRHLGIGAMVVQCGSTLAPEATVKVWHLPKIQRGIYRPYTEAFIKNMVPERKALTTAGTNRVAWSPFKQTCERVADYVAAHPGVSIKEVVAHVEHHYASEGGARTNIMTWAESGYIPGVRVERRNGRKALFPEPIEGVLTP